MTDGPTYDELRNLLKRQNAAIAEQEERFKKVLQTIPLGLVVFNKRSELELCNSHAQQILGYEPRDLKGKPVDYLFPDLSELELDAHARRTNARKSNDELIPVDIFVNQYDADLTFVHIQDITERVRLEQLRKDLLAMVSHDLRSPLTSMQFVISVATSGGYGELPQKALTAINRLDSVSERMISLVNDLLDSEQYESGDFSLDFSETTTATVVNRTIDNIVGDASKADVKVVSEVSNDVFFADPERIIRVLTNLAGNAIKFAPKDSTITIFGGLEGTNILLKVKDQGPGVPENLKKAIFDRYRQLDQDKEKKRRGVGLGLFICKALVEKHGGKIWVESELGHGSTFCVSIPQTQDST